MLMHLKISEENKILRKKNTGISSLHIETKIKHIFGIGEMDMIFMLYLYS